MFFTILIINTIICKFFSYVKFEIENGKDWCWKFWVSLKVDIYLVVENTLLGGSLLGRMDGWMVAKAGLRIAYSNQKFESKQIIIHIY